MTHQRTTSGLAFTARPGAARVARAMAAVRPGTGAIGVLAPGRPAWRLFWPGRQPDQATALALRAAAARGLALGPGTALASRRGPDPLRGWLPATALAGCCDALTITGSTSAGPAVRTVTALVSGLSASAQIALARRLTH